MNSIRYHFRAGDIYWFSERGKDWYRIVQLSDDVKVRRSDEYIKLPFFHAIAEDSGGQKYLLTGPDSYVRKTSETDIRPATADEVMWLEACILAGKLVKMPMSLVPTTITEPKIINDYELY